MADAVSIAVIDPAIPVIASAFIGAVVAIVTVVFAFKTAALNKRLDVNDVKISEVIKTSDGMKDALVAITAKASHAEGALQEKQAETIRKAEIVIALGQDKTSVITPQPAASKLVQAIDAVPEKTATKVVEKLVDK